MEAKWQAKLAAMYRASEFIAAQPDDADKATLPIVRLQAVVGQLQELDVAFRRAGQDYIAFTRQKNELRRQILAGHLTHVRRTAQLAAAEQRDLAERYALPKVNGAGQSFLSAVRGAVAAGATDEVVLLKFGLIPGTFAKLAAQLAEYEQVLLEQQRTRRERIAARAEMRRLQRDGTPLIRQIDSVMRVRFGNDPDRLAAWRSASAVTYPAPARPKEDAPAA